MPSVSMICAAAASVSMVEFVLEYNCTSLASFVGEFRPLGGCSLR